VAKSLARQAARDLARNSRLPEVSGKSICVTDEDGNEVFRTPLKL
jgi:hypothetical protein